MRYSSRKSTTVCGYVPQCAKRLVGKLVQCLSPERALALLSAALAAACFAAEASYLSGSDGDQASTVALFVCGAFFACASAYSQCCLTRRPRIVYREPHQRVDFVSKEGGLAWVPAAAPQLCRDDFAHPPKGRWFRDNAGRAVLLRGVNLGGASKMPRNKHRSTAAHEGFYDSPDDVTFVGRPFPLDAADEHLVRLRSWGLTFLRLVITWEAVEHAGPGVYDEEYVEYVVALVRKCQDYGISVFLDPHQDVWSRWTGGDGAPAWTLTKVGFKLDAIDACGAALTQQAWVAKGEQMGVDSPFPKMIWGLNYQRLACATMWTLFWAGNELAPKTKIDGESAQDFLQGHYIRAMARVARAVKDEPNVLGFDTLNEPSPGWAARAAPLDMWGMPFLMGHTLSPLESMFAGNGHAVDVDFYAEPFVFQSRDTLNPDQICVWEGGPEACVWRQNGVWAPAVDPDSGEITGPKVLAPDHFRFLKERRIDRDVESSSGSRALMEEEFVARYGGKGEWDAATVARPKTKIDFSAHFEVPFFQKFRAAIRAEIPDAWLFCESSADFENEGDMYPPLALPDADSEGFVWAGHHYDVLTLVTKRFRRWVGIDLSKQLHCRCCCTRPLKLKVPVFGHASVTRALTKMIQHVTALSGKIGPEGVPAIVGEIGIPFDMEPNKYAYRTNDFSLETAAMDTNMRALDASLSSFTLWCYTPENNNQRGDLWNDEDLSIFSRDQIEDGEESDIHAGGRALPAVVRPYAQRTAGKPLHMSFDAFGAERLWTFEFEHDRTIAEPTVIFVPQFQYVRRDLLEVRVDGREFGKYPDLDDEVTLDWPNQTLYYAPQSTSILINYRHKITISKRPGLQEENIPVRSTSYSPTQQNQYLARMKTYSNTETSDDADAGAAEEQQLDKSTPRTTVRCQSI